MNCNFACSYPYPEVGVTRKDCALASILQRNLASSKSEMTAIHQYIYQSWILHDCEAELSNCIEKIAMVEMRHLDILGRLICLLGERPIFQACQNNGVVVWNGCMVNYVCDIRCILTENQKAEMSAYETYTEQAKSICDPKVSAILARIAQDEKMHAEFFHSYLESFCA